MIADVVAVADDAFYQTGIFLPVTADDEKRRGDVFALQNVQNLRCPLRIRSIVKRQGDHSGMIAGSLNDVARRYLGEVFAVNQAARVEIENAAAVVRFGRNLQNLARAFKINIVTVANRFQIFDFRV